MDTFTEQKISLEKARMGFNIHFKIHISSLTSSTSNLHWVCCLEFLYFFVKILLPALMFGLFSFIIIVISR